MSTQPVGDVRSFTDVDSPRDNRGSLLSDFHALSDKSPADAAKQIREFQAGDKNDVPDGFPDANQFAIAGLDVHNPRNESRTAGTLDVATARISTLERGISFDTNRSDVMVRFERSVDPDQRADASRRNGDEWRNGTVSFSGDDRSLHLGEGKPQPDTRLDGRHEECNDGHKDRDNRGNERNDDPNCKDGDKKPDGHEKSEKDNDPDCKDGEKKNDKKEPNCQPKPEPPQCEQPEPPKCGDRPHVERWINNPPSLIQFKLPEPAWLTNPYRGRESYNEPRPSFPSLPFLPGDIPGAFAQPFLGDSDNRNVITEPSDLIEGLQNVFGRDRSNAEPRLATPEEFVKDLSNLLFGNCSGRLPSPTDLISGLQRAIVKGDNDSSLPTPPSPDNFLRGLQQLLSTNGSGDQSVPSPEQFVRGLSHLLNLDSRQLGSGTVRRHLGRRDAMNSGGDFVPRCDSSFDPGRRGPLPYLPGIDDIPMPRLPGLPQLPNPGDLLLRLPVPPDPTDLLPGLGGDLPGLPGLPALPNPSDLIGSLPPLPVPGKFPLPSDLLPGLPLPSLPGLPELPVPKSPLSFLNPGGSKKGGFLRSLLPF